MSAIILAFIFLILKVLGFQVNGYWVILVLITSFIEIVVWFCVFMSNITDLEIDIQSLTTKLNEVIVEHNELERKINKSKN